MQANTDRALSFLFAALLAIAFVIAPLGAAGVISEQLERAVAGSLIACAALVVVRRNAIRIPVVAIGLAGVAASIAPLHLQRIVPALFETASRCVVLAIMCAVAGVAVFRGGRVTIHRVFGSIALYLQVALMFASAYEVVANMSPDAFSIGKAGWNPLYFSLVTISTTGYGDIVPLAPISRSLATLEAMFGTTYPATVIARLVTLELSHTMEREHRIR